MVREEVQVVLADKIDVLVFADGAAADDENAGRVRGGGEVGGHDWESGCGLYARLWVSMGGVMWLGVDGGISCERVRRVVHGASWQRGLEYIWCRAAGGGWATGTMKQWFVGLMRWRYNWRGEFLADRGDRAMLCMGWDMVVREIVLRIELTRITRQKHRRAGALLM